MLGHFLILLFYLFWTLLYFDRVTFLLDWNLQIYFFHLVHWSTLNDNFFRLLLNNLHNWLLLNLLLFFKDLDPCLLNRRWHLSRSFTHFDDRCLGCLIGWSWRFGGHSHVMSTHHAFCLRANLTERNLPRLMVSVPHFNHLSFIGHSSSFNGFAAALRTGIIIATGFVVHVLPISDVASIVFDNCRSYYWLLILFLVLALPLLVMELWGLGHIDSTIGILMLLLLLINTSFHRLSSHLNVVLFFIHIPIMIHFAARRWWGRGRFVRGHHLSIRLVLLLLQRLLLGDRGILTASCHPEALLLGPRRSSLGRSVIHHDLRALSTRTEF